MCETPQGKLRCLVKKAVTFRTRVGGIHGPELTSANTTAGHSTA